MTKRHGLWIETVICVLFWLIAVVSLLVYRPRWVSFMLACLLVPFGVKLARDVRKRWQEQAASSRTGKDP